MEKFLYQNQSGINIQINSLGALYVDVHNDIDTQKVKNEYKDDTLYSTISGYVKFEQRFYRKRIPSSLNLLFSPAKTI